MELLAPAGSIEVFEAAVENGADAVYIGAPELNARALAKSFSLSEIAALIDYAHKHGVKVYAAMNSLLKEEEIPLAIKLLAVFSSIKLDAVIIQDLGLLYLARKYFPNLRLHASTLLGAHNSYTVKQFSEMGFSRVVLAREMSIDEITASASERVDVEVFVHGAMCFSFSGLCMFSSYLGGKSGLRGRCVQPCRRRYISQSGGKASSGYFFSMNDLSGIKYVDQLQKAGVSSLKIEGRMKSSHYVGNVVKSYRMVIDNPENHEVQNEACRLLSEAMGRKDASGYFIKTKDDSLITHKHSGNIGIFLGNFSAYKNGYGQIKLKEDVNIGDRFRIHFEKNGERTPFTLKKIIKDNISVNKAVKGDNVLLPLPDTVSPKDSIYKVDTYQARASASKKSINPSKFKNILNNNLSSRIAKIVDSVYPQSGFANKISKVVQRSQNRNKAGNKKFIGKKFKNEKKDFPLPWWLKIDDFNLLKRMPRFPQPQSVVVLLTEESFRQFHKTSLPGWLRKNIIWSLPPVIFQDTIAETIRQISQLYKAGFKNWQLGHIGQIALFKEAANELTIRYGYTFPNKIASPLKFTKDSQIRSTSARFNLCGNYTLNLLNSLSLKVLSEYDIGLAQILIEADEADVADIGFRKRSPVGMTIYGTPALFTSRLAPDFFQYGSDYISPKKEKITLTKSFGQTLAIADQPFSLLEYADEIKDKGIDFVVVDLTFRKQSKGDLAEIFGQINGKHKSHNKGKRIGTFNYKGKLQ